LTCRASRGGFALARSPRRCALASPAGRELQQVIEWAIGDLEQHWKTEVGPERWAAFREVLAQVGGAPDPGGGPAPG
jgi:hypothetical protein